jgi:hypothetical protein
MGLVVNPAEDETFFCDGIDSGLVETSAYIKGSCSGVRDPITTDMSLSSKR